MYQSIKKALYFPIAYYFSFFAKIRLSIWKPKIIVITGSNSKTTLLHMLESQIEKQAIYSHQANSAYGVPFNILNLKRTTFYLWEWPFLFLMTPINTFLKTPREKIYVVEADCDRPNEGKFLAKLLRPSITVWTNSSNSHAVNFPSPVLENIAYEFGYFLENTKDLCIINEDSKLILGQLKRVKCKILKVTKNDHLQNYKLEKNSTSFKIDNTDFNFDFLLPEDSFYSIFMCLKVLKFLGLKINPEFKKFKLPAGRSSLFSGIKNTTIIDSSYNATPSSMGIILQLFEKYKSLNKWLILGDMIELGSDEKKEHEKLALQISKLNLKKIVLIGPRLSKFTFPKLKTKNAEKFDLPGEALEYIKKNLSGNEVLLFKGARFLEGIIEHLLKNKSDINKLCRREDVWEKRREGFGL